MLKRTIAALAAVILACTLAACGDSDDGAGGKGELRVGLFGPKANSYFQAYVDAGEEWAKDNGATLTVFDSGFDPQQQFTQVQDAIAQKKVDGMVIAPLNGPALASLVRQAKDAGISTVAIDAPLSNDFNSLDASTVEGLDGLVMIPADERGENLAKEVVMACEGIDPCKTVYEAILLTQPAEVAIYESFKAALEAESNVELLGVRDKCMGQRDAALGVTQDLLTAEPDVDVIASADQCLIGAEIAIERAGKTFGLGDGDIRLVGGGGTTQGIAQVLAEKWVATLTGLPREEMVESMKIIKGVVDGSITEPVGVNVLDDDANPPIMDKATIEKTKFKGQYSA